MQFQFSVYDKLCVKCNLDSCTVGTLLGQNGVKQNLIAFGEDPEYKIASRRVKYILRRNVGPASHHTCFDF